MGVTINTNLASLNTCNKLQKTDEVLSASLESLLSGLHMNVAAEDTSEMAGAQPSVPRLGDGQDDQKKKLKVFSFAADCSSNTKEWCH